MTEKSMFFYNATEIESRPSYNPTQEISPENFHALIGMYRFDDDVICQVRTSSGICHQKHKSGWLGVTHEGDEAYIGGHCAKKYFRADSRFKLEKNRVKSEIERNTALNKIEEYLSNKSILKENLSNLRSQLIDVRKELDLFYKTFPGGVLRFIDGAQRTGNWSIMVDVLTPYSNNQIKNNKKQWHLSELCKLKKIPKLYDIIGLIMKVKVVIETYDELCSLDALSIPTPKLKKIIEVMSMKDEYEGKLSAYQYENSCFFEPKNLDMLLYVCDDYEEEYIAARSIMTIIGTKVSSAGHINLRIKRIKQRVEKQFLGCEVRKNQIALKYKSKRAL